MFRWISDQMILFMDTDDICHAYVYTHALLLVLVIRQKCAEKYINTYGFFASILEGNTNRAGYSKIEQGHPSHSVSCIPCCQHGE